MTSSGGAGNTGNTPAGAAGMPPAQGGTPGGAGANAGGSGNDGGGSSGSGSGGSPPGPTNACKRGIAWPGNALTNPALLPGITWWYNWVRSGDALAGVEYVPMIWGGQFDVDDVIEDIPSGAAHLLGFNEPNFFEQADLSAQEAAAAWPGVEQVADALGLSIVSPAVNFCGNDQAGTGPCHDTNPVDYLTDFFAACQGCRVDYVAVHWYNCTGDDLVWYLDQFKVFGKPIWLTEFACAYGADTSVAGQEAYMREALPILEADPDVVRYAWFSGNPIPNARLLDDSGNLTPLGQVYVELERAPCVQ